MAEMELRVHGSIFYLLKKFVVQSYSIDTWGVLNKEAGTAGEYELTKSYPLREIEAIVAAASYHSGIPVTVLKETFGEYTVPDLFQLYSSYLKPEWKTYEVLVHTEDVFHGAVRKLNSTAHPPILNVTKAMDNVLYIDYHSRRRMGALAVGIIKGIAKYYNEGDRVKITSISEPDAEKVQIRVEFDKTFHN